MSGELQIVAVGARTPIGLTAESSAAAARGGINRISRQHAPNGDEDVLLCSDSTLGDLSGTDRMIALGRSALAEVLSKLEASRLPQGPVIPVIVGLPEERPGYGVNETRRVLAGLASASKGRFGVAVEPLPLGHAAALEGLRHVRARLDSGHDPIVIVGGIDSYIDHAALDWLVENDQWQREGVRSGFIPGEGAAFVALMRPADARSAGLAPLALVRSAASARETKLLLSEDLLLGEGLVAAVAEALTPLGRSNLLVDDVYCDINGERYRSEEWGFVALRLASAFRDPTAYRTAVGRWGDAGAATGALNLVLATQAWQRLYARGDHAMVWASSLSGLRTAVLLGAPQKATRI